MQKILFINFGFGNLNI